jgi:hypothetical protein
MESIAVDTNPSFESSLLKDYNEPPSEQPVKEAPTINDKPSILELENYPNDMPNYKDLK